MTLPDSRSHNYAPNSQVYSEDLNDIQDAIVYQQKLKTSVCQFMMEPMTFTDANANQLIRFRTPNPSDGSFKSPLIDLSQYGPGEVPELSAAAGVTPANTTFFFPRATAENSPLGRQLWKLTIDCPILADESGAPWIFSIENSQTLGTLGTKRPHAVGVGNNAGNGGSGFLRNKRLFFTDYMEIQAGDAPFIWLSGKAGQIGTNFNLTTGKTRIIYDPDGSSFIYYDYGSVTFERVI